MSDLSLLVKPYEKELERVRIMLDFANVPAWWFCDKDDDTQSLTDWHKTLSTIIPIIFL